MDVSDGATSEDEVTFGRLLDQGWFATYLASNFMGDGVLNFAAACRATNVVRLTPPLPVAEQSKEWHNPPSRYSAHEWQPIPSLPDLELHSTHVRCEWRDQGWGNRKGMLCVVREGGAAPDDYQPWGAAVLCGKEPAPHEWEALRLSYRAPAEHHHGRTRGFRLCARAGGGGGHSLSVRGLVVRAIAVVDTAAARAAFRAQFPAAP